MKKYLYFAKTATDTMCLPADELIGMEIDSGSEAIHLTFTDKGGGIGGSTVIQIGTGTANQAAVVIKAIAEEIRVGKEPFIVVADENNSVYLHANIDAVDAALEL